VFEFKAAGGLSLTGSAATHVILAKLDAGSGRANARFSPEPPRKKISYLMK